MRLSLKGCQQSGQPGLKGLLVHGSKAERMQGYRAGFELAKGYLEAISL